MTATCLTTIFFAEAEAVDAEDTARTNCLVTKAMVQRWRRRRPRRRLGDPAEKAEQRCTSNPQTSGGRDPGGPASLRAPGRAVTSPADGAGPAPAGLQVAGCGEAVLALQRV